MPYRISLSPSRIAANLHIHPSVQLHNHMPYKRSNNGCVVGSPEMSLALAVVLADEGVGGVDFGCFSFEILAQRGGWREVMGRLVALVSWCS